MAHSKEKIIMGFCSDYMQMKSCFPASAQNKIRKQSKMGNKKIYEVSQKTYITVKQQMKNYSD